MRWLVFYNILKSMIRKLKMIYIYKTHSLQLKFKILVIQKIVPKDNEMNAYQISKQIIGYNDHLLLLRSNNVMKVTNKIVLKSKRKHCFHKIVPKCRKGNFSSFYVNFRKHILIILIAIKNNDV